MEFVNLRRRALDHQVNRPDSLSASASRALLSARLDEATSSIRPRVWQPLLGNPLADAWGYGPAWIGGAVAVLLMAALVVPTFFPPQVSAKEVIAKVEAAEKRPSPAGIVHQRVRIRGKRKSAASEGVADYELWTSTKGARLIPATMQTGPAGELQTIYESRGASWASPLSIASYAKLRESLGQAHTQVSGHELITLTSAPAASGSEIRRIEFTVRHSDWHALAQRILLTNAEYEITELLHEVVPPSLVDPAGLANQLRRPSPRLPGGRRSLSWFHSSAGSQR